MRPRAAASCGWRADPLLWRMLLLLPLALGCTHGQPTIADDTAIQDTEPVDTAPDDTPPEETGASEPVDLDGDGTDADSDCDDRDPDVFPGAPEAWNEVDDDCDGVVDADGSWSGSMQLAASAIYEGQVYNFGFDCPFDGVRAAGAFDWAIVCSPDPTDADAQRMLGASLTLAPDETSVEAAAWSDRVRVESSNGWDTDGDGAIDWTDVDRASVRIEQGSLSLSFTVRGTITRE